MPRRMTCKWQGSLERRPTARAAHVVRPGRTGPIACAHPRIQVLSRSTYTDRRRGGISPLKRGLLQDCCTAAVPGQTDLLWQADICCAVCSGGNQGCLLRQPRAIHLVDGTKSLVHGLPVPPRCSRGSGTTLGDRARGDPGG